VLRLLRDQEEQLKVVTLERDNARHHGICLQRQLDLQGNDMREAFGELETMRWCLYQLAAGRIRDVTSKLRG
jgi:hypothetical protein